MKLKAILILLFISTISLAQIPNDILLNKVLLNLNLNKDQINHELVVCKSLPYDSNLSVIVIPKYHDSELETLDAYIILVNNQSSEIINTFYQPKEWTSDAIILSSIEIDTKIYQLNQQTKAFGILVNYTGSSRINPYSNTDLSLYITQKNQIKRVINNLSISSTSGEWDTICSGNLKEITSTITTDKNKTNGFYNLIVNQTIKKSIYTQQDNNCIEKAITSKKTNKLKFNGLIYN